MTDVAHTRQSPLFSALLTPHRSISDKGIRWVIAFTAILASIPGLTFFAMGAWPIVGLLGLDVLMLWWALSASLKSGDAFEEVTLWPDELDIRHVSARGTETRYAFNPFYVRLEITRDSENRVIRLSLVNRDQKTDIGTFLTPYDKDQFARAFADALARAKR